jgi:hypothetical protein
MNMELQKKITDIDKFGEQIDKLITVDIGGRGLIDKTYSCAKALLNRPLTSLAAEKLIQNLNKGDCVFIITGLNVFGSNRPETDGPPGAVALARALQKGLGIIPILITHEYESFVQVLSKTAMSGELTVFPDTEIKEAVTKIPSATTVIGFPIDSEEATQKTESLFNEFSPKALIAVESRGANKDGNYHLVSGVSATDNEAKMTLLFNKAIRNQILTIGIFDVCGIEIGFGKIAEEVIKVVPSYAECTCGCGGPKHDCTEVDVPVTASVSNLGAYGVCAALSFALKDISVFHDGEIESRMLLSSVAEGAVEGITKRSMLAVDGISGKIHSHLVDMMREILAIQIGK